MEMPAATVQISVIAPKGMWQPAAVALSAAARAVPLLILPHSCRRCDVQCCVLSHHCHSCLGTLLHLFNTAASPEPRGHGCWQHTGLSPNLASQPNSQPAQQPGTYQPQAECVCEGLRLRVGKLQETNPQANELRTAHSTAQHGIAQHKRAGGQYAKSAGCQDMKPFFVACLWHSSVFVVPFDWC